MEEPSDESASAGRSAARRAHSRRLSRLSTGVWQSTYSCGIARSGHYRLAQTGGSPHARTGTCLRVVVVIGRSRHRSEPGARVAPNLLDQEFTATRPNEKWTGDITAIWTYEGWLYLAVVLDLYSRRVIGWAMAATQDEALIERAFQMALLGRHPPAGVLFHSDRGSQYTSDAYQALLADIGATVSMSRTGNCYDNAVTESFFGTLKGECVERTSFQTRGQARQTIFEYVEMLLQPGSATFLAGLCESSCV